MFDETKENEEEVLTNFTTTFPPPETIGVIKRGLEEESFVKVNVNEEIRTIRSEHYNKKWELQLEIEINIIDVCEGFYIVSAAWSSVSPVHQ